MKENIGQKSKHIAAVVLGTFALSPAAYALETAAIDTAFEDGTTAVATVVAGVIGLTALALGIGLIMSLMKRA